MTDKDKGSFRASPSIPSELVGERSLDRLEALAEDANDRTCWLSASLALETLHKRLSAPVVLELIDLARRGAGVTPKLAGYEAEGRMNQTPPEQP